MHPWTAPNPPWGPRFVLPPSNGLIPAGMSWTKEDALSTHCARVAHLQSQNPGSYCPDGEFAEYLELGSEGTRSSLHDVWCVPQPQRGRAVGGKDVEDSGERNATVARRSTHHAPLGVWDGKQVWDSAASCHNSTPPPHHRGGGPFPRMMAATDPRAPLRHDRIYNILPLLSGILCKGPAGDTWRYHPKPEKPAVWGRFGRASRPNRNVTARPNRFKAVPEGGPFVDPEGLGACDVYHRLPGPPRSNAPFSHVLHTSFASPQAVLHSCSWWLAVVAACNGYRAAA